MASSTGLELQSPVSPLSDLVLGALLIITILTNFVAEFDKK
jgi:hypothetical protein